MLQADAGATVLLAEIHLLHDEGLLASDPTVAAKLLGVQEGCSASAAKEAAKKKFHAQLGHLQEVGRQDVESAMKILQLAEEAVVRGTRLWVPQESDVGVRVTRALGCKDLKVPVPLLTADPAVEIIPLGTGESAGLALIADGTGSVTDSMIAKRLAEHSPGRPQAAALRIGLDGARAEPSGGQCRREAVSVVCAFFGGDGHPGTLSAVGGPPAAKRARIQQKPERVRVSHILLKWAGLKGEDEFLRPGIAPPTRTKAEAEQELLQVMEELLAPRAPSTLAARFKVEVLKRSECSTALNVPYADLGWMDQGDAEPSLEVAAFDTPVSGLSDVVVTSRGVHLMYRLA
eukprot:gnl/TRDRNA2_/TRDRNA2_160341_c0_seq2.p1 gnl/TRDRNA2_/TRDRNA2_160341_c0~~gnl/TRDRNA2_/TRDRNA2_160341_c0_seq2.p1  ORF type:complete len:393 (+),score=86.69 gnl/TRDRNA2_/TRDRNA2_160341_c0_seq2:143-1180(+)